MDNVTYDKLLIKMYDSDDHSTIDKIARELSDANPNVPITLLYKEQESTASIRSIIDLVFMVTIAIMMFLSFFSLSASMSANLYD